MQQHDAKRRNRVETLLTRELAMRAHCKSQAAKKAKTTQAVKSNE